jgi:GTP-binding protein
MVPLVSDSSPPASHSRLPRVSIVGAPNVGKSTLFNRLTGGRRAIVTDRPGVTRDRIEGLARLGPGVFTLVDTGGILPEDPDGLARAVTDQALRAVSDSDLVLLVLDARRGLLPLDADVARLLRVRDTQVIPVANKVDGPAQGAAAAELSALGLGEPVAISAEHGLGISDLLLAIEEAVGGLPAEVKGAREEIRVSLVGRPNVGKSSLLNHLVGDQRMTVSEVAGTTRDAVDTLLEADERCYRLVDTAGMRRAGKLREVAERASVARAHRAVRDAHVVVVLLDATAGLTSQDLTVIGATREAKRPMILAVNKWDLVEDPPSAVPRWTRLVRERVRFAPWAPLLFISALTGRHTRRLLPLVDELERCSRIRIPTPRLNRLLAAAVKDRRVPGKGHRAPRLYYATQTGERPPRFLIFTENARRIHFSFRRYLENRFRDAFDIGPTPIVLQFRDRPRRGDGEPSR